MRVTFYLKFKNFKSNMTIPPDYRIKIYSFIKDLIKQNNPALRDKLWGTAKKVNCIKPFTFTCFFPGIKAQKNSLLCVSDSFSLTVSFGNYTIPVIDVNGYEIFFAFYNGLIANKKDLSLKFNGTIYSLALSRVVTHKEKLPTMQQECIKMKSCAPLLIRQIAPGQKPQWLDFTDKEFDEWCEKSVSSLVKGFLGRPTAGITFIPRDCKTVYLNHYKGLVKGTEGVFALKAKPEVVKLVYEVGLGAKRNEGFGMIEVV